MSGTAVSRTRRTHGLKLADTGRRGGRGAAWRTRGRRARIAPACANGRCLHRRRRRPGRGTQTIPSQLIDLRAHFMDTCWMTSQAVHRSKKRQARHWAQTNAHYTAESPYEHLPQHGRAALGRGMGQRNPLHTIGLAVGAVPPGLWGDGPGWKWNWAWPLVVRAT